jgi:hypothetical protein
MSTEPDGFYAKRQKCPHRLPLVKLLVNRNNSPARENETSL